MSFFWQNPLPYMSVKTKLERELVKARAKTSKTWTRAGIEYSRYPAAALDTALLIKKESAVRWREKVLALTEEGELGEAPSVELAYPSPHAPTKWRIFTVDGKERLAILPSAWGFHNRPEELDLRGTTFQQEVRRGRLGKARIWSTRKR